MRPWEDIEKANQQIKIYCQPQLKNEFRMLLLNLETKQVECQFDGHLAFSPSEQPFLSWPGFAPNTELLVTGSEDGRVLFFRANQPTPVSDFKAHDFLVNCVSMHPKLDILLTVSDGGDLKIWVPSLNRHKPFSLNQPTHNRTLLTHARQ